MLFFNPRFYFDDKTLEQYVSKTNFFTLVSWLSTFAKDIFSLEKRQISW